MLDANLGLFLYGNVSVMNKKKIIDNWHGYPVYLKHMTALVFVASACPDHHIIIQYAFVSGHVSNKTCFHRF